ncbi:MAG TPA: adenosylcobinamide-GDP ribazoletransferase [Micromonosporaceae bacterium]|jgi:adenosylcobinamide-GDP ribazoletransferase
MTDREPDDFIFGGDDFSNPIGSGSSTALPLDQPTEIIPPREDRREDFNQPTIEVAHRTEHHQAPGLLDGLRLAVTTFTVVPFKSGPIDRRTARIAMGLAPYIGLALGVAIGGIAIGLRAGHSPALLTGLVCVGVLAALTRGLHLDGLADTVDGLGSYRSREQTLAVMKSPEVGAFGVVALILSVGIPAVCIATLSTRPWWSVLAAVAAACACGRLAAAFACRRGVPAASSTGLGATVAETTGAVELALGVVVTAVVAIFAVPHRSWQGPVAVFVGLAATIALVAHATRRLGGITGDVLGACVEIATAVTVAGMVLGN